MAQYRYVVLIVVLGALVLAVGCSDGGGGMAVEPQRQQHATSDVTVVDVDPDSVPTLDSPADVEQFVMAMGACVTRSAPDSTIRFLFHREMGSVRSYRLSAESSAGADRADGWFDQCDQELGFWAALQSYGERHPIPADIDRVQVDAAIACIGNEHPDLAELLRRQEAGSVYELDPSDVSALSEAAATTFKGCTESAMGEWLVFGAEGTVDD